MTQADLVLLHQQFGDYLGAWKELEKAVELGKVRSVGISNFESERLEELCEAAVIKPAVLQVECHPYYAQSQLKERAGKYGTKIEAWFPLAHADRALLDNPVFAEIGKAHGKTAVQVILRWHLQEGNILIPKTSNPEHLEDDCDIYDFELNKAEMQRIASLDTGRRFFTLDLKTQEQMFLSWSPAD